MKRKFFLSRTLLSVFAVSIALWAAPSARSQNGATSPAQRNPSINSEPLRQQLAELLRSVDPAAPNAAGLSQSSNTTITTLTPQGHLRYVSAPPGHHFPSAALAPNKSEEIAYGFLKKHKALFGASSPQVDFAHLKTKSKNNRKYVRFEQTYSGLPVFAAQVTVQLDSQGRVECVLSDIERNTKPLDEGSLSSVPKLSRSDAIAKAHDLFQAEANGNLQTAEPRLTIFAPSVLGETGNIRLTWEMIVTDENASELNERIFIDAHSGNLIRQFPLHCELINRRIFDANNSSNIPSTPTRTEGQVVSGISDLDNAYDFLGDTYYFYLLHHGRDSIDGNGLGLDAVVRDCPATCPWRNARWTGVRMELWAVFTTDDVTGHELTHGVTQYESGLIYANASGAINESFSDVWGEFIDLTNSRGNDSPSVRWDIGEDLPIGRIRSMKDPTLFNCPDRVKSPLYYTGTADNGGVHWNSGVNNKLCYLLTDGDTFNGQSVTGMGISRVAALYYEVNANLLTSGADWTDLYNALCQAAINLGWSPSERDNLYRACAAVEIGTMQQDAVLDQTFNGTGEVTTSFPIIDALLPGAGNAVAIQAD